MAKKLTFYRGDEYRAKIETEFEEDGFFEDVYLQARKNLLKIIREAEEYKREHKACGYKIKYQGMGNNVILFTSKRGQGKTSAMLSFAEFLRSADKNKGVLQKIDGKKFLVLDAIDPTSFDKDENLLRVLVSRLFVQYGKIRNSKQSYYNDNVEDQRKKADLLKLFRDCYNNIEALRGKTNKEDLQDNLEHLIQLGNSASLKENLFELVEQLLRIMENQSGECCDRPQSNFLVVQIDDADLFSDNVFEICEDVHHYLSIPNVIVLMATDFAQLRYCLMERYLKQYKELQDERSGIDIYEKCHEMAVRYLEKVFPDGHRINLPVINNMTAFDYAEIELFYGDKENKKQYNRICDYLLKQIYQKTGIILLNIQDMVHPILPHTLRELSHFLSFLSEMPDIDFKVVCADFYNTKLTDERRKEITKLKNNIQKIKDYFLDYWCKDNLSEIQHSMITKIDMCERRRKLKATVDLLRNDLHYDDGEFDIKNSEITYHYLMHKINTNSSLQHEIHFQYALLFYYTLFLNEWFVDGLGLRSEMIKFADFIETPVFEDDENVSSSHNGYNGNKFSFSLNKFVEYAEAEGGMLLNDSSKAWLEYFTDLSLRVEDSKYGSYVYGERIVDWTDYLREYKGEDENAKFDVLRATVLMLINGSWIDTVKAVLKDHDGDKGEDIQQIMSTESVLLSLKNVLTNYEVQYDIQKRVQDIQKRKNTNAKKGQIRSWTQIDAEICLQLDIWEKATIYGEGGSSQLGRWLETLYNSAHDLLKTMLWLCNEENFRWYCEEYKKRIINVLEELKSDLNLMQGLTDKTRRYGTVKTEIQKIPHRNESDWLRFYPETFGNPAGIKIDKIEELNEHCQNVRDQYTKVYDCMEEYQKDVTKNKEITTNAVYNRFRFELNDYRKFLDKTKKQCEEL